MTLGNMRSLGVHHFVGGGYGQGGVAWGGVAIFMYPEVESITNPPHAVAALT